MHFLRTHYMFQVFFAKVKEDIFFYKKHFLFIQTASKIKYKFLQSLPKCHHWNQIPFIADINCHLQPSRQQVLFSFHIASKQNWFSIQLKSMSIIVIQKLVLDWVINIFLNHFSNIYIYVSTNVLGRGRPFFDILMTMIRPKQWLLQIVLFWWLRQVWE